MKRIISIILALSLLFTMTTIVFAGTKINNQNVKLWYPSQSSDNEFEYVTVEVPQKVKNLLEYAIKSLLEGKGLEDNLWNEIPQDIELNSLIINDNVAELDFNSAFVDNITYNHSIYFIINSIKKTIFEFDQIDSFVIKVNGKKVDEINDYSLAGKINRNKMEIDESNKAYAPILRGPVIPDPVIYLDAGHGGSAPGAIGADGTEEADINLAIALKVRDYLEDKGATVIMSRISDITKDMNTRVNEANSSNADFVVTIHCNASTNTSIRGFRTYYTSTHYVDISQDLAEDIDARLIYTSIPRFNNPITHDGIGLLTSTNDLAVLVEAGFMSNSQDLQLLKDSNEQSDIAYNIYVGIRKWWWGY